jgi:hypothetical protein
MWAAPAAAAEEEAVAGSGGGSDGCLEVAGVTFASYFNEPMTRYIFPSNYDDGPAGPFILPSII